MEGKFVFQIILGAAILVSVCLAAPNNLLSNFFNPLTKEVRIPGRVEVVHGPTYTVQGRPTMVRGPTYTVQGQPTVVRGPTYTVQGGPSYTVHGGPPHVIQGGPPHVIPGPPTHVMPGGPTHVINGPPVLVGVGHVLHQPPPPPPPVFTPGASHQCICTQPNNCRKTSGLHRCSEGKVNFNNIGAEVCCPTPDVIC